MKRNTLATALLNMKEKEHQQQLEVAAKALEKNNVLLCEALAERDELQERLKQKISCEQLYQTVCSIPPGVALEMVRRAESDEERNFFAFISDMNLQREQKKAIERNLF